MSVLVTLIIGNFETQIWVKSGVFHEFFVCNPTTYSKSEELKGGVIKFPQHTVEITEITLAEKKFRQINYLVSSLVSRLLSRKFCQKKSESRFP